MSKRNAFIVIGLLMVVFLIQIVLMCNLARLENEFFQNGEKDSVSFVWERLDLLEKRITKAKNDIIELDDQIRNQTDYE